MKSPASTSHTWSSVSHSPRERSARLGCCSEGWRRWCKRPTRQRPGPGAQAGWPPWAEDREPHRERERRSECRRREEREEELMRRRPPNLKSWNGLANKLQNVMFSKTRTNGMYSNRAAPEFKVQSAWKFYAETHTHHLLIFIVSLKGVWPGLEIATILVAYAPEM